MKKFEMILLTIAIIAVFTALYYTGKWQDQQIVEIKKRPLIDLPEEYKSITPNDTLRGYFTSDGQLHIEFNNQRNQNHETKNIKR